MFCSVEFMPSRYPLFRADLICGLSAGPNPLRILLYSAISLERSLCGAIFSIVVPLLFVDQ